MATTQNTKMAITTRLRSTPGACGAGILTKWNVTACVALVLLLAPCLPAQNPVGQSSAVQQFPPVSAGFGPGVKNIPISAGDLLDVQVFDTPELSTKLRVDQIGKITLPLGGEIEARGLTAEAAAQAIERKLISSQIMLHPMVMVNILEYATEGVTLLGEVKSSGIYTLLGPHSLYDALASAGGVTSSAGASITITHADDPEHPVVVKVSTPNYSAVQKATIIQPGDTVFVSKADLVYVVGDIARSGAFYLQNGQRLTVLELLSLAQGTTRTSAMTRASVVRPTTDGRAITIRCDLDKIMKNQVKDIALEAGDILVVPRSGWKTFGIAALPAVTNAAMNAVVLSLVN